MNKSKLTEEQIAGIFEEAAFGEKRQASQMPASLRPPGYQYNATTGLRTQVEYFLESSGWSLDHKQEYGYDSNLDYLTGATYSTTYTGSESWTYDAAGNRTGTGYAYDNLNRMESSPGYVYQNDVLGNRTWRNFGQSGVQRYVWDEVNRLKSVCGTSEGARYEYRADGMRMKKVADLTITWNPGDNENEGSGFYDDNLSVNKPTTRYFYDGQMPMEEDFKITGGFGSPTVTVTQYGLGARGIDWIRNKVGSDPETIVFPIYDGHGNMVYTLKRDGTDDYLLGNKRIYGAWGDLRHDGNPGSGPNTQYVGNLGHKKDSESGLTYMRARYYEPGTGRFVSEDIERYGANYYIYCNNNPIEYVDISGNSPVALLTILFKAVGLIVGTVTGYLLTIWIIGQFDQRFRPKWYATALVVAGFIFQSGMEAFAEAEADGLLDRGKLLRGMRNSLRQTGWGRHFRTFGMFFAVGLALGITMGMIEGILFAIEQE